MSRQSRNALRDRQKSGVDRRIQVTAYRHRLIFQRVANFSFFISLSFGIGKSVSYYLPIPQSVRLRSQSGQIHVMGYYDQGQSSAVEVQKEIEDHL
jgi:hypothetical protein